MCCSDIQPVLDSEFQNLFIDPLTSTDFQRIDSNAPSNLYPDDLSPPDIILLYDSNSIDSPEVVFVNLHGGRRRICLQSIIIRQ